MKKHWLTFLSFFSFTIPWHFIRFSEDKAQNLTLLALGISLTRHRWHYPLIKIKKQHFPAIHRIYTIKILPAAISTVSSCLLQECLYTLYKAYILCIYRVLRAPSPKDIYGDRAVRVRRETVVPPLWKGERRYGSLLPSPHQLMGRRPFLLRRSVVNRAKKLPI